jgi:AbrB family looped-hinge helix DNA binding protein
MTSTLSRNGQVTIPKKIREALNLQSGCKLNVVLNTSGSLLFEKVVAAPQKPHRSFAAKRQTIDRFEQVRGKADVHWRTQDLMNLFRGEH